ncbi:uncharacterized protein LOC133186961 [Saccostrea echinata]|uniref:uncharacterized protein LOC133186961 n=1 Tax=Saccostrea echinata TaxID=191078 RepID=UPI002A8153B8|nr:uncharacterized protein LOC133186961 [Saccostrea echinata]
MSNLEIENTHSEEYEDPATIPDHQNPVPLTSNPVYSLASAPDYELLSGISAADENPVAKTNHSETPGSAGYEDFGISGSGQKQSYDFVDAIQSGSHEYQLVSEIAQIKEKGATTYEGLIKEYSFDVTVVQTPDVKELGLTGRYKLVLGNLSINLHPRLQKVEKSTKSEPIYMWFYADIRRYSFSKQMREFAIYCGRSCPTPEKVICFRVKTDLVQLLQVVNEKTGGAFEAELANIKVKKRVCTIS